MFSKSVTVLLEKSEKVKNVFKKCYGPSGKKWKSEECLQKLLLLLIVIKLGFKIIKTWRDFKEHKGGIIRVWSLIILKWTVTT